MADSLDSLINQSFQDFEVIIVNDGSTDSTQDIIDEYCEKYSNFYSITQKNQGVAIARNNAIKMSKGDYICFLDSDGDYYVLDSLENINTTINNNNFPDLVIGRQTMLDPWGTRSYENAKELSNLDKIEPYDKRILWTMSLINKVFSRKKILEAELLMPNLTHASDAVFTLSFIYSCDSIVGCPHEFLIYKKRLFFDEHSLSQKSSIETINDYFSSYEIIEDNFISFAEKYRKKLKKQDEYKKLTEFDLKYLEYLDELRYREATILFIDQIYRFFWRMDKNILERCKEILLLLKSKLAPVSWERLQKRNKDLFLDDLIIDREIMAENPILTIVVNNFEEKIFERIISNIYNSYFPAFEVVISKYNFDNLDETFKSKENIKIIDYTSSHQFKNIAIDKSNGEYIIFIDDDIFFSPETFKFMFNKINDSNLDWISLSNPRNNFYISNKLIKLDFLKKINFSFTKNFINDMKKLKDLGSFKKFNSTYISNNIDHIHNTSISVIIDEFDVSEEKLNNLLESIYLQEFCSYEIFLNKNLRSILANKYLKRSNVIILNNENFKKEAIKKSKAKYGIFVDFPIIYNSSAFKDLFFEIDGNEEDYSFVSSPISKFSVNNRDEEKINCFSSQRLIYSYKNINNPSNRSKFIDLDLYLSNKLIKLDILRKKNIDFSNYNIDVSYLYKNCKFLKINKKIIWTELPQKEVFKFPFKDKKVPFKIMLLYKIHKIFFIALNVRNALKNGAK